MDLTALWPTVTLIIGIVGTLVVERLRDGRQEKRETEAREAVRQLAIDDRRENFEIDTLQATYDAMHVLARAAYRYHFLDRTVALKLKIDYASRQIAGVDNEAELGEALRLANMVLSSKSAMTLDPALRDQIRLAANATNDVSRGPKSVELADTEMDAAQMQLSAAQDAVATRIRAIYLSAS
jgi:hypothetical protein